MEIIDVRGNIADDRLLNLINARRDTSEDVAATVERIITAVRTNGDRALLDFTAEFDHHQISTENLKIGAVEIDLAASASSDEVLAALEHAASRIRAFHKRQLPTNDEMIDEIGVRSGLTWNALESVGLYVPGGTAAYPSSVLMNAIPAKVAGCERLVMVVPTPNGEINNLVLAAAKISGVDEIYRIGGAQAIGALAYGTETIAPVDKVVGPGNAYVAEAKRQVFGRIGIDMIAGPSEILVIADDSANPAWVAADLLSQAEHDVKAQSILITDSESLANRCINEVDRQLPSLPRADIARESWQTEGAIILANKKDFAQLANRVAPEHLELMVENAATLAASIRRAGAIFIGHFTPEVIGDYVGGPNHVLPTNRSARFASGLSVYDFMTRSTYLECNQASFRELGPIALKLAQAEGLEAHARAASCRLGRNE